jgi:phytol kinase
MNLLISTLVIAALLMLNEIWWRINKKRGELSRKFIHILVGTFVAFWPFYLSWSDIRLTSVAFLVVVLISVKLKLFKSIHDVNRKTAGEILFAVSVGLITFVTQDKYIYAAAILEMSLADGLAAILGKKYGSRNKYKIWSQHKSITGSAVFLIVSLAILLTYGLLAPGIHWSVGLVFIALAATVLENISVYGLDNLVVPVAVAALLRL